MGFTAKAATADRTSILRSNMTSRKFLLISNTLAFILLIAVSFLFATTPEEKGNKEHGSEKIVGRVETVTANSMKVRVGDATKTFSFDNKTVFTYGAGDGKVGDLKSGDQVLATVIQGKATKVNATEQMEGIIQ